ncbi:MAG: TFIIB-type zinc ribbon-containing protein [Archaeoglobaceae archaeon]
MKRLLICPICKSKNVVLDGGGYTGKYRCLNCGYVGAFILEMTEGELKEIEERKSIDELERKKGKRGDKR